MQQRNGLNLELRRTQDFEGIRRLALESGLEDGSFASIVAALGLYSGKDLVGCAALKQTDRSFSVEWLAVSEPLRKRGLGGRLIAEIELEARLRGADRLWALARAPGFFQRLGFRLAGESEGSGPTLDNCMKCPQYMRSCRPAIVVKAL
ncbi:MAG: GNAT family N-acetyltransferase [Candidatus Thermoplasmatota archaeon]|nr:GNAT family N-acetyltransferase [Candidatus Thermoplasmatota archaeon]